MNSKNKRFLKYLKQLRLENGSDTPIPNQTESRLSANPTGLATTMTKPEFKVMQMTPEKAKTILIAKNRNNRNLKASNLKRLTRAIENGEWKITNQGIAFDDQGNLIDGQHRLAAIVQTGVTLPILVGTNMDPRIFDCVDTGAARTAGDGIDILGSSHGKTIAAAIKSYHLYNHWPKRAWSSIVAPSSAQIVKIYEEKKDSIEALYSVVAKKHKNFKCFPISVGLCFTMVCLDAGWSDLQMWEFWDAVTLGANLQPDSAVLSFRNQLNNVEYRKRGWSSQRFILNAFIVCFNKHVQNIPTIRFIAPRPDTNMYKVEKPAQKETSILEVIKAQ